jgi:hypothetical protein
MKKVTFKDTLQHEYVSRIKLTEDSTRLQAFVITVINREVAQYGIYLLVEYILTDEHSSVPYTKQIRTQNVVN